MSLLCSSHQKLQYLARHYVSCKSPYLGVVSRWTAIDLLNILWRLLSVLQLVLFQSGRDVERLLIFDIHDCVLMRTASICILPCGVLLPSLWSSVCCRIILPLRQGITSIHHSATHQVKHDHLREGNTQGRLRFHCEDLFPFTVTSLHHQDWQVNKCQK